MQAVKRYGDGRDHAADPLFKWVDEAVWSRPTFAAFRALLDNYVWCVRACVRVLCVCERVSACVCANVCGKGSL